MKFICVGRNYNAHAKELNNPIAKEPVIFMKPDTAMLKPGFDFYYPEFTSDIHFEAEFLIKIAKEGKFIQEKFAHKYYDEVGVGIDFTARDVQKQLQSQGLPWELAKGFNGSAVISNFTPKENFNKIEEINFSLNQNGETKQRGCVGEMNFSVDQIISFVSKYFTLKKGDIIFTGTPAGVGPIAIGDQLEVYLEKEKMISLAIK